MAFLHELAEKIGFAPVIAQEAFHFFLEWKRERQVLQKTKKMRFFTERTLSACFYVVARKNHGQLTLQELADACGLKIAVIWKEVRKLGWSVNPITAKDLMLRFAAILRLTVSQRLRLSHQLTRLSAKHPGMSPKTLVCFCVYQDLKDDIIYKDKAQGCLEWLCRQLTVSPNGVHRIEQRLCSS